MYISLFWCGVIATVLAEISLIFAVAIWARFKKKFRAKKKK
jgi:hypothetical protein